MSVPGACSLQSALEQPRERVRAPLSNPLQPGAPSKGLERDLLGVLQVIEKDLIHVMTDRSIEHHQGRLVVERHRAVIEVHRAHGGPLAVNDERLGVERAGLPLVEPYARCKQRVVPGATGVADDVDVGTRPGRQDANIDPRRAAAASRSMKLRSGAKYEFVM